MQSIAPMQTSLCSLSVCMSLFLATTLAHFSLQAADWTCWRGPDGLGVSSERRLPTQWSPDKNRRWKTVLPGKGASSPIVVGDRVYVTAQTEDTALHVLALDRVTGTLIWDRSIGLGRLKSHNLHNMATPTPVSDGRHVWALFGTGDLACLTADGQTVWQRNLVKEYGDIKTNHGYGTSPMLLDGTLFLAVMHQGPSYVLAVDAATGDNRWKKERQFTAKDESQDSYSSPIFARIDGQTQVVFAGAETINAYDPRSGEVLWVSSGHQVPHPYGRTIAGPAAADGIVLKVASGFQNRGYTVALKPSGRGELPASSKLWTQSKFAPDCPCPVIYQGKVYTLRDDGMASCLDLASGEVHWQERLFAANVKVSPVAAAGHVYFLNGQGNCTVVAAQPTLKVVAQNDLNETTLSSPALAFGHVFLRTDVGLYCFGQP
jgi:outer membrane protein assembly factor BamB